jgi:hypothetical protein
MGVAIIETANTAKMDVAIVETVIRAGDVAHINGSEGERACGAPAIGHGKRNNSWITGGRSC